MMALLSRMAVEQRIFLSSRTIEIGNILGFSLTNEWWHENIRQRISDLAAFAASSTVGLDS